MIPVAEISKRLNDRAESVCQMLLPGGRMMKSEWLAGGIEGGEGNSLKVQLAGHHVGNWKDWANPTDSGDLLDLWRLARNLSPGEAVKQAKDYLGIQDPARTAANRTYARAPEKALSPPTEGALAFRWLTEVRKLKKTTIDAFRVSTQQGQPPALVFESFSPGGEVVNRSYRTIPRNPDEKKKVWQDSGCAPALFGWQAVTEDVLRSKTILLTEGQIDAMTWHQWGIPALSIPNGTGMTWVEYEWENLEFFERIFLAFDGDSAGSEIRAKVIARLGSERCYIVSLPEKDANDALKAGRTAEEAQEWLRKATAPRVQGLVTANDLLDRLREEMRPKPQPFTMDYFSLNWKEQAGFYFRSGEVTLWTGHSHAGKSTFLNCLMNAYLATMRVEGVFIGSFEVKPETTLRRMATACIAGIGAQMCEESAASYLAEYGDRIVLADVVGFIDEDPLFEMMRFAFRRYGVAWFIIDSLMKIKGIDDDYPAQGAFINRLQEFAKSTGVHVHLVAHPRKGQGGTSKPGILDIKGSSVIANGVDNIIAVCRNNEKSEAAKEGELTPEQKEEYDTEIRIEKQKESGWLGAFFLRFNPRTFVFTKHARPRPKEKQEKKPQRFHSY